jgi:hypothetical protein
MGEATSSTGLIKFCFRRAPDLAERGNNAGVRTIYVAALVQRPDAKCWSRPAQYRFHWSVEGFATDGAGLVRACAAFTRSPFLRDAQSLTDPFPLCSFMRSAPSHESAQQIAYLENSEPPGGAPQFLNKGFLIANMPTVRHQKIP